MFQGGFHFILTEIRQTESRVCLGEIRLEFQRVPLGSNGFRVFSKHRIRDTQTVMRWHKFGIHAECFLILPDRFLVKSVFEEEPRDIGENLGAFRCPLRPLQRASQLV